MSLLIFVCVCVCVCVYMCVRMHACVNDCSNRYYWYTQALLELYNSDALIQFDEEKLLALAEKAKL